MVPSSRGFAVLAMAASCVLAAEPNAERYRPQFHFSSASTLRSGVCVRQIQPVFQ